MGLHLPPKSSLQGRNLSAIQKAARRHGWMHRNFDQGTRCWHFETDGDPDLQALIDSGWAAPSTDDYYKNRASVFMMAEQGTALMGARLRKRTPIAKADVAFAELMVGVDVLNGTGLVEVAEVWLFGSYMRRAAEVGDIDAVIFTRWVAPNFDTLTKGVAQAFAGVPWLERAMENLYGAGRTPADEMTHRLIFGDRRKPLLDGVQVTSFENGSGYSNLGAGMPAQRVFTRDGGWVAEDPVDRHASSEEAMDRPYKSLHIDQGTFSSRNEAEEAGPLRGALREQSASMVMQKAA